MTADYKLSQRADQDLFELYLYGIQTFGLQQADIYATGMQKRFQEIAEKPKRYPTVDSIRAGYRRSVYGVHSIYYQEKDNSVTIIRILRSQVFTEE